MGSMLLPPSFFPRPTLEVAQDLIGTVLSTGLEGEIVSGRIVEVEAYLGAEDPASHAARGATERSAIMFGPPGVAYVYFIYGVHHCLNVVTEPAGQAGAVLIRALEPLTGSEIMLRRRAGRTRSLRPVDLCNGPGKLCQALGIDLSWNGMEFGRKKDQQRWLSLERQRGVSLRKIVTPRIGIRRAVTEPYRFVAADSRFLSRPVRESG
jgi:DNA-3-methyladenine glycosylase